MATPENDIYEVVAYEEETPEETVCIFSSSNAKEVMDFMLEIIEHDTWRLKGKELVYEFRKRS